EKIDGIDVEREIIYFTASPDNATQRYLYCVDFRGENLRRVTPAKATGTHTYSISPNGRLAIHRRSSASRPPVINLVRLPRHRPVRMLERNDELRKQLKELKQPRVEFFQVPIDTTTSLDAWAILPPDLAASLPTAIDVRPSQDETTSAKKYPLLVYVYGEPAGSTVRDQWGGNGQLWHWMLAQQGYVVMSFDNRGTNVPRGRQWRKSIYRQVGILAPGDQASAVRQVLKDRPYLDPTRVGVWGWSGGGSMTLNAMLKYPELYKAGISVAPVPNQRFYDTIYQERYMGLPDDNVEGYLQGSAINFANQLQGTLLLIHGTGDDNCHYQGTETLINALIKHKKPFTMMAYPNRSHSISEGDGTTYHLRQLMTNYLHNNL
ncbi:MAG: S9 family peptidase, partial [Planctomycetales bacterium]|nr:S9 family peptidase [Planctomycetales bacterium]